MQVITVHSLVLQIVTFDFSKWASLYLGFTHTLVRPELRGQGMLCLNQCCLTYLSRHMLHAAQQAQLCTGAEVGMAQMLHAGLKHAALAAPDVVLYDSGALRQPDVA